MTENEYILVRKLEDDSFNLLKQLNDLDEESHIPDLLIHEIELSLQKIQTITNHIVSPDAIDLINQLVWAYKTIILSKQN